MWELIRKIAGADILCLRLSRSKTLAGRRVGGYEFSFMKWNTFNVAILIF